MVEKKIFDWDVIEREYSKGTRSNSEIARQFNISEGAIRKRAKQYGWAKDLKAKIKLKADEAVRVAQYEAEYARTPEAKRLEKELVEHEAEIQKRIRIEHRKDIGEYRALNTKLRLELEENIDGIDICRRIDASKKLSDTLKTLIGLEREAFGISDNANGEADNDIDSLLKQVLAA